MTKLAYKERLTQKLSTFIKKQAFDEWVENIGDEYFIQFANTIPVKLSKYYDKLNIIKVLFY